jgi:hypothetical protein
MLRGRVLGIAIPLVAPCLFVSAAAAEAPFLAPGASLPVHVETSECQGTLLEQIVPLLRVEIGPQIVDAPTDGASCRVVVECSGDQVALSATAPERPPGLQRIDLASSPPGVRARIVALAIAELVRDLLLVAPAETPRGGALRVDRAPGSEGPERDRPAVSPRADDGAAARRTEIGAYAQAIAFASDGRWLAGGGIHFEHARGFACVGLDARMATGTEQNDLGTASFSLADLSPWVAWRSVVGRTVVRLGAGYALGVARINGRANGDRAVAATVSGPYTAPFGLAALSYGLSEALNVEARGQAGWVTSPVVGLVDGGADIRLEGGWASMQIGMALAL